MSWLPFLHGLNWGLKALFGQPEARPEGLPLQCHYAPPGAERELLRRHPDLLPAEEFLARLGADPDLGGYYDDADALYRECRGRFPGCSYYMRIAG